MKFLRFLLNIFFIIKYRRRKITLSVSTLLNFNTKLEGYNVIWKNAVISNSIIGKGTYIGADSKLANCSIGRFCSIADNVSVIVGNHPLQFVSTSPSFFSLRKQNGLTYAKKQVFEEFLPLTNIGNDVWIGEGAIIIGGKSIGDGAVIGAGAIVKKDVPPYAIVVGNPAKILKYRFDSNIIAKLLDIKWWEKSDTWLTENVSYFEDVDRFIKTFS